MHTWRDDESIHYLPGQACIISSNCVKIYNKNSAVAHKHIYHAERSTIGKCPMTTHGMMNCTARDGWQLSHYHSTTNTLVIAIRNNHIVYVEAACVNHLPLLSTFEANWYLEFQTGWWHGSSLPTTSAQEILQTMSDLRATLHVLSVMPFNVSSALHTSLISLQLSREWGKERAAMSLLLSWIKISRLQARPTPQQVCSSGSLYFKEWILSQTFI